MDGAASCGGLAGCAHPRRDEFQENLNEKHSACLALRGQAMGAANSIQFKTLTALHRRHLQELAGERELNTLTHAECASAVSEKF